MWAFFPWCLSPARHFPLLLCQYTPRYGSPTPPPATPPPRVSAGPNDDDDDDDDSLTLLIVTQLRNSFDHSKGDLLTYCDGPTRASFKAAQRIINSNASNATQFGGGGGSSSSSDQGRREGGVGAREQDTTATQPLLQAAAVVAEAAPSSLLAPPRPLEVATFQTKFAELVSAGVAPNEAAAQALHLMQQQPGQQAQTSSVSGGSSSSSSSSGDCLNAMQVDSSSISSSSSSPLSQATATTTTAPVIGVGVDAGLGGMDGGGRWASELSELASMGFSDSVTNAALLERYQGRLVRVINALTGGD
mmetsp:Transcript_65873/g.113243  ORF Transcript_65873/g.113243 Transcript_65873/m.113243 type:complete len:304 (+) Transcript_65873:402-1313(+)